MGVWTANVRITVGPFQLRRKVHLVEVLLVYDIRPTDKEKCAGCLRKKHGRETGRKGEFKQGCFQLFRYVNGVPCLETTCTRCSAVQ